MNCKQPFIATTNLILLCLFAVSLLMCGCSRYNTPADARLQVRSSYAGLAFNADGTSHMNYNYWLQKDGGEIKKFNAKNLIEAVSDNDEALAHAKTYKVFRTISIASCAAFLGGITYGILGKEKNPKLASTAFTVGLVSMPTMVISGVFASHKAKKSIKTYNGF